MQVDNSLLLRNSQGTENSTGNKLGKDDFLKLLMAQLENQNPLKPMKNKEFISQMATFSSLEQMTNLNQTMRQFIESQSNNQWMAQTELIGKEVSWEKVIVNDEGENVTEEFDGLIASVHFNNGEITFETENGEMIKKDQMLSVSLPSV